MPRPTSLTATGLVVPNVGTIWALVEGLEEGREFRHSRYEDGVRAPQYVEIREDVPVYCAIEAQLQAMGYEFQWQRKRWRVWRNSRQLPAFSPDLHEADRPAEEPIAPQRARPGQLPLRQSGESSDVESAHKGGPRSPLDEQALAKRMAQEVVEQVTRVLERQESTAEGRGAEGHDAGADRRVVVQTHAQNWEAVVKDLVAKEKKQALRSASAHLADLL